MAEKPIRIGIVGGIRGAGVGCKAFSNSNCELVALCDKNPDTLVRARATFDRNGGKDKEVAMYEDFDEMLAKEELDAIYVATDATCHVPFVKKAMEAGKHVLSEIPTIATVEEAHELKEIVNNHKDLVYMAGENCCYWKFVEAWKKMREDGRFGEIVYAEGEYLHALNPDEFSPTNYPEGHWRATYAAIKYLTHEMGPLLYIMDDRCVSVTCMEPDITYNPYFPDRKATGVALFKTAKGAVIRILVCFGAYASCNHSFRIFGTRGLIENDRNQTTAKAHSFANLHDVPGTFINKIDIPIVEDDENGHGGADKNMFDDFIRCIVNGEKPKFDVDKGIEMSLPGILAHESALNGGAPIEIPII